MDKPASQNTPTSSRFFMEESSLSSSNNSSYHTASSHFTSSSSPSASTNPNDMIPAPLSIPAKSSKRPVGKPLQSTGQSPRYSMETESTSKKIAVVVAELGLHEVPYLPDDVDFEEVQNEKEEQKQRQRQRQRQEQKEKQVRIDELKLKVPQNNNATRLKQPQFNHVSPSSSTSSYAHLYELEDPRYPLGHGYIPPNCHPLPNDPLFTITTHDGSTLR